MDQTADDLASVRHRLLPYSGGSVWQWGNLRQPSVWFIFTTLFVLVSIAGSFIMARVISLGPLVSDLRLHVQLLIDSKKNGNQLGYTIYYTLLDILGGGADDPHHLLRTATIILGLSIGLRVAVTYLCLAMVRCSNIIRIVLAVSLSIMMPLSVPGNDRMYLGKFTGTIWHNSTTILALPFCLILFIAVVEYLERNQVKPWFHVLIVVLIIACGSAKPNYILAFCPAVALYALWIWVMSAAESRGQVFRFLCMRAGLVGLVSISVCGVIYVRTFAGPGIFIDGERVTNTIRPLEVWEMLTRYPLWAFVSSFLLPAISTVILPRNVKRRAVVVLAWITCGVALAQFLILAEVKQPSGRVLSHANWIWGALLATFVLTVVVAAQVVNNWTKLRWTRWIVVVLAVVEVILGGYFLINILSGVSPTSVRLLS